MLRLNETLVSYDPAQALENEAGVFELTSPGGEKLQVICRSGRSITNIRCVHDRPGTPAPEWRIKKIAELRAEQEMVA